MAEIPKAAEDHYVRMQRLQALAVASARRAWARVEQARISESWERQVRASVAGVVSVAQVRAAESGASYSAMTLAEQGAYSAPEAWVAPAAFGGYAADGRALETLLDAPAYRAKELIAGGAAAAQALEQARGLLDTIVRSTVSDAGRQATSVDIAARANVGYVRMLNPPSCSRCTILAGRYYRWNAGFRRHPGCDCVHVASRVGSTQAALSEGLIDDPYEYFESLSESEQDRVFGKNSARAIRDGSSIFRVVNAKRGAGGMFTSEGTGRQRGKFSSFARDLKGRRLTPDGIYAQGLPREETLALLERHGYLFRDYRVTDRIVGSQGIGEVIGINYQGFGQMGRGGTRRGASNAVRDAEARGFRDASETATMTAAERRVYDARLRYQAVVIENRHPIDSRLGPPTPQMKAEAELDFRRSLMSGSDFLRF